MKLPTMAEKNSEKVWKTMAGATWEGDVPVMKALRLILRWRTDVLVEKAEPLEHEDGPCERVEMKTQVELSHQEPGVRHTFGTMGRSRERLDTREPKAKPGREKAEG